MGINWSSGADSIIFDASCTSTWTTESLYCAAPQRILSTDPCCGICSSPAISGGGTVFAVLTATGLGLIGHFLAPQAATSLLIGQILASNMYVSTILCRVLWGPGGGIQRWHGEFGVLLALGSMPLMASVALSEDYHLAGFSSYKDYQASLALQQRVNANRRAGESGRYAWTDGKAVSLIYRAFKSHERHVAEWTIGCFFVTCVYWWTVFGVVDLKSELWQTNCDETVAKAQGRLEFGACIAMLSFMTLALVVFGYQLWYASRTRPKADYPPRAHHHNHFLHLLRRLFVLTDRGTWEWRLRLIVPFVFWTIWAACILSTFKVALANFLLVGGQPWSYGVVQNMILASTGIWGFFSALRARGVFVRGSRGFLRKRLAAETPTQLADRHKKIVDQGVPLEHRASEAAFDGTSSQKIASEMTAEAQFSSKQKHWFKKCRAAWRTKARQIYRETKQAPTVGNEAGHVMDDRKFQSELAAEVAVYEQFGLYGPRSSPDADDDDHHHSGSGSGASGASETTREQGRIWFAEILSAAQWNNAYVLLAYSTPDSQLKQWIGENHVADRREQRSHIWNKLVKEETARSGPSGRGKPIYKRLAVHGSGLHRRSGSSSEDTPESAFKRMKTADSALKLMEMLYPNSFREFGKPTLAQQLTASQWDPLAEELAKPEHADFIYASLVDFKHWNRYIWPHKAHLVLHATVDEERHATERLNPTILAWNAKMFLATKYTHTIIHAIDEHFAAEGADTLANTSVEDGPLSASEREEWRRIYRARSHAWAIACETPGSNWTWIKHQLTALNHAGWFDKHSMDTSIDRLIQAQTPGTHELQQVEHANDAIELHSDPDMGIYAQPKDNPLSQSERAARRDEYERLSDRELWDKFAVRHRVSRYGLAAEIAKKRDGTASGEQLALYTKQYRILLLIETENPGTLRRWYEPFFEENEAEIERTAVIDQPLAGREREHELDSFDRYTEREMTQQLALFKLASHCYTDWEEHFVQVPTLKRYVSHRVLSFVLQDCLRPRSIERAIASFRSDNKRASLPNELRTAHAIVSQGPRQSTLSYSAYAHQVNALLLVGERHAALDREFRPTDVGARVLREAYHRPGWVLRPESARLTPREVSPAPDADDPTVGGDMGAHLTGDLSKIAQKPKDYHGTDAAFACAFANASLAVELEHPGSLKKWDEPLWECEPIQEIVDPKSHWYRVERAAVEHAKREREQARASSRGRFSRYLHSATSPERANGPRNKKEKGKKEEKKAKLPRPMEHWSNDSLEQLDVDEPHPAQRLNNRGRSEHGEGGGEQQE